MERPSLSQTGPPLPLAPITMCRFVSPFPHERPLLTPSQLVYKGTEPIQLSHLVTRPLHSIAVQVFDSRLRFGASRGFPGDQVLTLP
jgi:hypothetical protein